MKRAWRWLVEAWCLFRTGHLQRALEERQAFGGRRWCRVCRRCSKVLDVL